MALDRIKFNIASFNDADAGGNNYYAGIIYEVFNSNDTLADIYSDAAGANPINQDGISNKSSAIGEVVFYIDSGDYYIKVNEKVEYFSTLLSSGAIINNLSLPYVFDTVDDMTASVIVFPVGKVVKFKERETGKGGGGKASVISGTGTANNIDILASDTLPVSYEIVDKTDIMSLGVLGDGSDNTLAVARYLQLNQSLSLPKGTTYITSLPDLSTINSGNNLTFKGLGSGVSTLEIKQDASDILFDNFLIRCKFLNMKIKEVDGPGGSTTTLGKCFDSSGSGAAFILWDDIRTIGFDVVGDVRQSVWCNIGTIECADYRTSPLNFVKTLKDGSAPTHGWNFFPSGWFNNALTVKNYLARRGVNGPIFEGSNISIDTLTTEGLTGNGARFRGNSPTDKMHLCTVQNLYFENIIGTGFVAENVDSLVVESLFNQGKSKPVAALSIMNLDEADVTIKHAYGQEWFVNGAILSNNSTLRGEASAAIVGGAANQYVIDATSTHIDIDESPHIKKWRSTTLANGESLTCANVFSGNSENLSLKIGVFYNGSPLEVQSWSIWLPSGGPEKIQQNSNGSNRIVGVTKVGDDLVITNNQGALSMIFNVTIVNESDLAIDGK